MGRFEASGRVFDHRPVGRSPSLADGEVAVTVANCGYCGAHVTPDYARVFGNNDDEVDECLDCRRSDARESAGSPSDESERELDDGQNVTFHLQDSVESVGERPRSGGTNQPASGAKDGNESRTADRGEPGPTCEKGSDPTVTVRAAESAGTSDRTEDETEPTAGASGSILASLARRYGSAR